MKTKIIEKATELFLKLGFKSITMDDIANEMAISKKTIYKFFCNKEVLIEETVEKVHNDIHHTMSEIFQQNHNAIEENFEIRRTFKELFKSSETSPVYQLKKHYPEIYDKVYSRQVDECKIWFRTNIEKGIAQGLYRSEVDIELYSKFYYLLIFQINDSTILEKEASALELKALEYHTRALSTSNGVEELEKQLSNPNI
ncbi:TetR/AcrR family transcriptional regulator [Flavobacterium sp. UBA6135]|uniref:TetR/AcrR family transcriptional regulator n=1 Tax=Flavobacterium sp. UBA6135 TaxID=1946553 RepID=UPI0025C4D6DF|nr:TetR/AcrR family transcriptional regulator [Flavobacterium sp. UBA6135]